MKRILLLATLFAAGISNAQLTQSNEPAIGETASMYLCDSNYTNYANVTGTGVVWDYSQIASYAGEVRTVNVVDPSTTTNGATYPTSAKALNLGSNITTYFSSSASNRTSQGFVFTEPSLGEIIVTFENDELVQLNYPFSNGSSLVDPYSGTIAYNVLGPTTSPLAGTAYVEVDGSGTLNFPLGVSVANVIRLTSIDTAMFNEAFLLGDVQVIREQYEYYDLATQNLPIFIHSTITVTQVGATTPLANSSIVLSKYPTDNFVGIEEKDQAKIQIYPSPATDVITVDGIELSGAVISILDQSGKVVKTVNGSLNNTLNVSDLQSGIYLMLIENNNSRSLSKFVKK